jgi:NitT/TauT family transport system ATP-binding protein
VGKLDSGLEDVAGADGARHTWSSSGAQRSGVQCENVCLDYPGRPPVHALDDVSLRIAPGQFISLIGPSGCGKSTLLRLIAGILKPTSGSIVVDGVSPEAAQRGHEFGFVFQDPVLLPWRSVRANVQLLCELVGQSRSDARTRTRQLIDLVGLTGFEQARPHQLSGGMRQRVAIARALAIDPPILLMDEPFAALDEFQRETLNNELLRIWEQLNNSVIFVTHNIEEAVFLSDAVMVMSVRPGRIVNVVDVNLPRPRDPHLRSSAEFLNLRQDLRDLLFQ